MDEFNRTEIFYAIVDNDYDKFLMELESIKNINMVDINGLTLLHFCVEYSRTKFAANLIQKGIDLEIKDKYGNNALWKACFDARGNYELVEMLIKNQANSQSKNNANRSPLELAITMGDERLIGLLSEPEFKYYADWEHLANLFNYEIGKHDQDWTYTISEPERIEEYLDAYDKIKNKEGKFSLLEMIIQSVNDQSNNDFELYWNKLLPILEIDFELNKSTIYYWCVWMNSNLEDCFKISEKMREYWLSKIKENVL